VIEISDFLETHQNFDMMCFRSWLPF